MNEDNKIFKTNEFSIEVSPVENTKQAKNVQYFSYDENSGLQVIHILMDGKPIDLPSGTEIRLSAVKLNNQNQKLIYTPEIVDPLKGIVSFVIPREFLGYRGEIRCGLYINFSNNQTMHVGYFYINMGVSDIDTNLTEFTEDFWQGWSEFEAGSTAKMQELEQRIDEQTEIFNNADVYNKAEIEDKLEPFALRTDIDRLSIEKADKKALALTDSKVADLDYVKADKTFVDAQLAETMQQKADKTEVETAIANMGSASPKGTYATLSALQTAYPNGTTGIYVVTGDGKWYYWSGSAWTAGGQYQSTGIAENSIDGPKLMAETIQRHNLSETYVNGAPGANLFDKNNIHVDKYINYKFELDDAAGYVTTNYIYISGQSKLTFKRIAHYAFYDLSYTPIAFGTNSTSTTTTIDVPEGASYIIFSFSHNDTFPLDSYMCNYGDTLAAFETYGGKLTLENMEPNLADQIKSVPYGKIVEGIPSKNLLNSADFTIGSYVNTSTGKQVSNADYSSNFGKPIKINGGQTYTIRNITFYCFYDGNNHYLSGASNGSNGELTITAPEDAANLIVSYPNSRANTAIVVSGLEIGEYEPYGTKLPANALPVEIRDQFSEPVKNISKTLIVDSSKTENAEDGVYTNLRTAFDSITDSAVNKQYEIIVYDNEINFDDLYPHANWGGGYYGLIAKDYVWITSADPDNPSKHLLKWDGHESLADDVNLTSAEAMAKSIMHVSKPNLTGAIDGFTLDVKNARYPFHFETAAAGNTWFKLKRCVLKWGGNPKVTGFQGATLGYGVSCGDHFSVEDCVITYTGEGYASTAGHNNGWDVSRMGPAPEVMPNARLTFKNCRFNNTGFRVDTVTSTDFDANRSYDIVTFENCKGIREYVFGLQGSATVSNWQSVKIGTV